MIKLSIISFSDLSDCFRPAFKQFFKAGNAPEFEVVAVDHGRAYDQQLHFKDGQRTSDMEEVRHADVQEIEKSTGVHGRVRAVICEGKFLC